MIETLDNIVIGIGAGAVAGLFLAFLYFIHEAARRDPFMFWAFTVLLVLCLCAVRFGVWAYARLYWKF